MTTFTTETKSQLARLLATENLRIEHQKIRTAKFDPKNRVLYCPIWTNMSGVLYDLLMGHEVGHALYTPAQGWHDAVCDKGRNYKSFLNVVEDARIEKKIKRKYPGIRKSFIEAYQDLMNRDFFGLKGRDINRMSFINRLNLFTKSNGTMNIEFTGFEEKLVEEVLICETWEDVLRVTGVIWDYSKEEQKNLEEEEFSFQMDDLGEFEDDIEYDEDFGDFEQSDSEVKSKNKSKSTKPSNEEVEDTQESSANQKDKQSDEHGEDSYQTNGFNRHKESAPVSEDQYSTFEPVCETDNAFRKNESALLDEKCKDYIYVTLPKPNLKDIVTPAKRVNELIDQYYHGSGSIHASGYALQESNSLLKQFKQKNERYISLLAKEFEMKKAASCYAKAKTSNTGDIDVSKLYKYQIDDTIFKKMMRVPKGKSHGLILLLDKSGSMSNNLKGSIEQILILSSFCRKVNIPFVVYGFGNNISANVIDKDTDIYKQKKLFSSNVNEINMECVFLREYINSKMSNSEFTKSMRNMIRLMNGFNGRYSSNYPQSESLSNTPLVESIVAIEQITQDFRKVNNLDIVNLAIIHDGDADVLNQYNILADENERPYNFMSPQYNNVILTDKTSKFESKVLGTETLIQNVLKWYTHKTGANVFGFFLTETSSHSMENALMNQYYNSDGVYLHGMTMEWNEKRAIYKEMVKKLKKEKLIISHKPGYKKFFIIPGGTDLQVDDGEIEIDTTKKVTATKLTNAFLKYNKKRQVNRVLVSKFIDGISV